MKYFPKNIHSPPNIWLHHWVSQVNGALKYPGQGAPALWLQWATDQIWRWRTIPWKPQQNLQPDMYQPMMEEDVTSHTETNSAIEKSTSIEGKYYITNIWLHHWVSQVNGALKYPGQGAPALWLQWATDQIWRWRTIPWKPQQNLQPDMYQPMMEEDVTSHTETNSAIEKSTSIEGKYYITNSYSDSK